MRLLGGMGLARRDDGDESTEITDAAPTARRRSGERAEGGDVQPLTLTPFAISGVLAGEHGITDPEAALRVMDLTGGWPLLVRLAGECLARDPQADLADQLTAPGAPEAEHVVDAVRGLVPERALPALGLLCGHGPVTEQVWAAATTVCGVRPALGEGVLEQLRQAGVLVPRRRCGPAVELMIVPLVERVIGAVLRAVDGARVGDAPVRDARAGLAAVAAAHSAEGRWLAAAVAHAAAGDHEAVAALLAERGDEMVWGGDHEGVTRLIEGLPTGPRSGADDEAIRQIYAEAVRSSGDAVTARRALAPLIERSAPGDWTARLAVRAGAIHYMRGEYESALATLDECREPGDGPGEEPVEWLAFRVHVLVMLGRAEEAVSVAARCLETAELYGSDRALGLAHLAASRICRGTRKELHHADALRHATAAGDAVTASRVLGAQTALLLARARYDEAVPVAREAARTARLSAPPGLQSAALHNLGEALARVGQLEEALWQLRCSVAVCRRLGPARAALSLVGIGDVHRQLGHEEQSRLAYAEAMELASGSGDTQVFVYALAGVALLEADESPERGREPAHESLRVAPPELRPVALGACGWVELACGQRAEAASLARQAVAEARRERASDLLGESLELLGIASEDLAEASAALSEARSIWAHGGAVLALARVELLIGRLHGADGTDRARARDAERVLRRYGVDRVHRHPVRLAGGGAAVSLRLLGPFEAVVDGREVPLPAWRSRQARRLVKILAAHRGRVVSRDRLCDLLWPDDDPARTGHRLSVLLTTVRGVFDPGRSWPADRYLAADQYGLRLDLTHVAVDTELLLSDAAHASDLLASGHVGEAREVLRHVDALYRGTVLEEEADEDWAIGIREEARAAWVRSVRRLATLHAREGRGADAIGLLVRLLAVDPYDESTHRHLVRTFARAGRHGEARRAFVRWCCAMREIDAPEPDPDVLVIDGGAVAGAVVTPR